MPWTYRHASREWRAFLEDAKGRMKLTSDNSAYTAVDAVFQVFRRRVTSAEGLAFASVLPSVPRAIFVAGWDVTADRLPFTCRTAMTKEAQSIRANHNLTPENCIEATAWAVRRSTNARDLERVLDTLSPEARDFWRVEVDDPAELQQRIV